VTFTATVSGNGPTGTVAFTDGASTITGCGAVAFSGGTLNAPMAICSTSSLGVATHSIFAMYSGDASNQGSASTPLSQIINASANVVWVEDAVPAGATAGGSAESWNWVSNNPTPLSGALAHQSALAAGIHQHYFYNATATLVPGIGDTLYAYVYR
jgi:hypothetical protein